MANQPIYTATRRTNAQAIEALAQLGHIRSDWSTLDTTYGGGKFWSRWRPDHLIGHDIVPAKAPHVLADFRHLPYRDNSFDVVVDDGPYKLSGQAGSHPSDARYGVDTPEWSAMSWQDVIQLNLDGITEAVRVARLRVLVKCQDQVCSGQKRWQTHIFTAHAEALGCRLMDQLLVMGTTDQPPRKCPRCRPKGKLRLLRACCPICAGTGLYHPTQQHARQNFSTLLVFEVGPPPEPTPAERALAELLECLEWEFEVEGDGLERDPEMRGLDRLRLTDAYHDLVAARLAD